MGFDSNGNWSSDFFPINDRDNSVPILASKFQTLIQTNLKQSFENCILRDGTGKPTANINWNGQKIINLANGTNTGDAVNKSQLDAAIGTHASEEQAGTIQISTEAQALAGTDDTTAMTPAKVKQVVETLATGTRFCVNSGYATNGKPDLLDGLTTGVVSFNVDDGTSYKPLVATTAGGSSFTLTSVETLDVSGFANGTYNIFVDADGNSYAYANTVYRQQSQPTSMNTNDIWFNTCEPFSAYIKTSTDLVECWLVQVPQTITITSNVVSKINTIAYYNDNGSGNDRASNFDYLSTAIMPDTTSGVSKSSGVTYTADLNGWLFIQVNGTATNTLVYNGVTYSLTTYDDSARQDVTVWWPISKGDTYKFNSLSANYCVFYPCKGVL